ncbi:MAG: hypothetical protein ACRDSP_04720 [Pseudonocardiaceae bacterium]
MTMVPSWASFLGRSVPLAVAIALPVAAIQPWQAQAGPEPTAVITAAASSSTDPTTSPTPGPEPGGPSHSPNSESHGKLPVGGQEPNPNCTVILPPNPLSAEGLTTPFLLTATHPADGPCHEANPNQSAFAEATIIDPESGRLSIYHPLVIDQGSQPAAQPVRLHLPDHAVVGLWFGFQGDVLTLGGASAGCVNGLDGSQFGQFAYCNATQFFETTNRAIKDGKLQVPPVATARDGRPCPTTRDFSVVDQDQSDNLTTTYLALPNGQIAQNNRENARKFPAATLLTNASDNALLTTFIDPALGCSPFTTQDLTNPGARSTSLALNELQAAASEDRIKPVALVPPNDPMVQVNGKMNVTKTNLYRAGVDQPLLDRGADLAQVATTYCHDLVTVAPPRLALDRQFFIGARSPDPAAANSLFTFLAQRLNNSFIELGCTDLLHRGAPIELTTDKQGVVVDARIKA